MLGDRAAMLAIDWSFNIPAHSQYYGSDSQKSVDIFAPKWRRISLQVL
jgi:hypothetical protein